MIAARKTSPMARARPKDFDAYALRLSPDVRRLLDRMRTTIARAAPNAVEKISYGMPCFAENGVVVWYAAHSAHIGFYPRPSAITAFAAELARYRKGRGSIQFPYDETLPLGLVSRMVRFRVKENERKANKRALRAR